ncbi:transglutaminase-like domain-containing protein [Psychromicrobium xiongbiense]|uniref:transglutaminase-like domain-containing protein n=1 Tax=Psychromicrobium xiongbiense TaxID=3051184 RepID=UPI0025537417|nr:transglutaminase-like domain-containing protein [Psychromicrobium sp. YIM S02556]
MSATTTRSQARAAQAWGSQARPWQIALDAGVLFLLLALGVLGFAPTFGGDPAYLLAGLGGAALGLALAYVGARWRLGVIVLTASFVLVYLLFGSALAAPREAFLAVLPTGSSLKGLLLGVVFGWKQLLTVAAPVGTSVDMLVVPYLAALIAGVFAGTLAWRLRSATWAMIPVLAFFLVSIIFGTSVGYFPVLRGTVLALVALAWLAFRRELARRRSSVALLSNQAGADQLVNRSTQNSRLLAGALVVVLVGAGSFAGISLFAPADGRSVLRDVVVPPLDPKDLPSPLTSFRKDLGTDEKTVLFDVAGLPRDGRVRLAAMDSYDGIVFNVDPNSSGAFAPVGDPRALDSAALNGQSSLLTFTIQKYNGVYLPSARVARSIQYTPANGNVGTLYLNRESDTAVKLDGFAQGDKYQVAVAFPPTVDPKQLATASLAETGLPKLDNVPQIIATKANTIVGNATTPYDKIKALTDYFRTAGKYTTGIPPQVVSLPGHGAGRISSFLTAKELGGNDEQYAVTLALMARQIGIPARVVMGFYPDSKSPLNGASSAPITGGDVHAWVEVNFQGFGWVPFDPTPDKDHVPSPPEPQNASSPKPQVLQPPPPPQERADLPPDSTPDPLDDNKKGKDFWAVLWQILGTVGLALIPVATVLLPFLLIVFFKRRRRTQRSQTGDPASRVGGGWNEMLSLAIDLGVPVNQRATRKESAQTLQEAFPVPGATTTALASRADAAIFGAGQPSEAEVAAFWQEVDSSLQAITSSLGRWPRFRARYSPRSLLREASAALSRRAAARLSPEGSRKHDGPQGKTPQRNTRSRRKERR